MITLILQIIALILLFLAGINYPQPSRVSLGWLGMFFWLLSLMVSGIVLHATR